LFIQYLASLTSTFAGHPLKSSSVNLGASSVFVSRIRGLEKNYVIKNKNGSNSKKELSYIHLPIHA